MVRVPFFYDRAQTPEAPRIFKGVLKRTSWCVLLERGHHQKSHVVQNMHWDPSDAWTIFHISRFKIKDSAYVYVFLRYRRVNTLENENALVPFT